MYVYKYLCKPVYVCMYIKHIHISVVDINGIIISYRLYLDVIILITVIEGGQWHNFGGFIFTKNILICFVNIARAIQLYIFVLFMFRTIDLSTYLSNNAHVHVSIYPLVYPFLHLPIYTFSFLFLCFTVYILKYLTY